MMKRIFEYGRYVLIAVFIVVGIVKISMGADKPVVAATGVQRNCAEVMGPIIGRGKSGEISSFILGSVSKTDESYFNALMETLTNNSDFAYKYGERFTQECLQSGLTIHDTVKKMFYLEDL